MELLLKSTITASDCLQSLKTVREDLTVRILDPGENPRELASISLLYDVVFSKCHRSVVLSGKPGNVEWPTGNDSGLCQLPWLSVHSSLVLTVVSEVLAWIPGCYCKMSRQGKVDIPGPLRRSRSFKVTDSRSGTSY